MASLRDAASRWLGRPSETAPVGFDARRLLDNPDFVGLFDSIGSPVARRLAQLQAAVEDPDITDPHKMSALKGELAGLRFVRRVLEEVAKGQEVERTTAKAAERVPTLLPVRPS